jgi:hypothetical protein
VDAHVGGFTDMGTRGKKVSTVLVFAESCLFFKKKRAENCDERDFQAGNRF